MVEEQKVIYAQPYTISVEVIEKQTARGDTSPEVKIALVRRLEASEKIEEIIEKDVNLAVEKAKNSFKKLKELG